MKHIRRRFLLSALGLALLLFVGLFPMHAQADGDRYLEINATNFPDATFRQWIIDNLDVSGDASTGYYMTADQVADVTWIDVVGVGIQNMKGVEKFTELTYLDCAENDLKSLDVSNNKKLQTLGVRENNLTTLDISNNTLLERLWCDDNQLTALNVSKNTALTEIYCHNNQLTALDVSKNTKLETLWCISNKLTSLNVNANTALTKLYCSSNQLTALDVSKNTKLETLWCYSNKLTSLNVTANTALTSLSCWGNQLSALDVSKNTKLIQLLCYSNKLTSLNVAANTALTNLYCYFNQLTALDLSKNTKLEVLYCDYNKLTSLNVSANTALIELGCGGNQLTALDVSKNTNLTLLDCYYNKLTSLNVGANTALTELNCFNNQLTALDVSKNTKLDYFNCMGNKISSLNVSANTSLTELWTGENQLTALNVTHNTALTQLGCQRNKITSLDVSKNTELETLSCRGNQLTTLDVSKNTKLETLYCDGNKLWSLTVNNHNALSDLTADQMITGKSVTASGGKYIFDLSNLVQDKSKVSVTMDGATYSASTGVITFTSQVSKFSYTYATGKGDMVVTVGEDKPIINAHPDNVIANEGDTVSFVVVAVGAQSYQWQYMRPNETTWNNVQDGGQTAIFYQTNVAPRHNGFKFRCKVSNSSGTVYSNTATLTLYSPPTITTDPSNVTASLGSTATFKVVASNATSYQWQYMRPNETTWNDVQNSGKSATFNQTNVEARHNGFKFRCKVSNASDTVYSSAATLTVVTTPPTITSQPASVTMDVGKTATFKVVASNATSYQWQYQKPGDATWYDVQNNGKSATFNQTNLEKRHNGFVFRCKVTNPAGSTYSNTAKLTVPTTAPTISSHPASVTKDLGTTATFKVTAANATSYQWQYQKPGNSTWYDVQNNGKSATFNQTNVEKRHNGFVFRCKVSNAVGTVYSNTAKLTVITTAPTITSHPASVTKDLGATATFKVTAANATSYQWQYQKPGNSTWYDVQVDGKSATFNQTNVAARHNGFVFRCKVSNGIGSVYSNTAKLTVPTTAPTISSHPASVTKDLGTTATFTVAASNATSYQWQYQIPGSSTWNDVKNDGKSATFNQTNVEKRHNGYLFRCKVTNGIGSVISNSAKLTVATTAPTISGQPSNVTATLGSTATFKVTSANATSYQWQYQIPGSSTWNDVQNNGKSATFNQTNVEKRHNGYLFRCKVTNALGTAYSNTAKLTVN